MVLTPKSLRELITANDADGERNNKETTQSADTVDLLLFMWRKSMDRWRNRTG